MERTASRYCPNVQYKNAEALACIPIDFLRASSSTGSFVYLRDVVTKLLGLPNSCRVCFQCERLWFDEYSKGIITSGVYTYHASVEDSGIWSIFRSRERPRINSADDVWVMDDGMNDETKPGLDNYSQAVASRDAECVVSGCQLRYNLEAAQIIPSSLEQLLLDTVMVVNTPR